MIKPHHKPCFAVCLLSGIAVWLTLEGVRVEVCLIFVVGAFVYALIAISQYPDDIGVSDE